MNKLPLMPLICVFLLLSITAYSDPECLIQNSVTSNHDCSGLLHTVLIAFIGGMVLNIMPCVLPVLSIKLLSIINSAHKTSRFIRYQFLATSSGIILSFLALAAMTHFLKLSGEYAGLGLNFQQPEFIIFLIFGLLFFASNLSDRITIQIPHSLHSIMAKHADEGKLIGSFFAGVFATLIATPCTAPFVGSAISFALSYGWQEIYLIFACIGLGMSVPYLFLALNPKLITFIPKSGKWMVLVKRLLTMLVYLTIIWLLYILVSLLDLKAVIILFLICLLLQFIIENNQGMLKSAAMKLVICLAVIAAGFFLPQITSSNDRTRHLEARVVWQEFSYKALETNIADGKVVIVDVTADWCMTCKYNKFTVLDNEFMLGYYGDHDIVTLRANYTASSEEINNFLASYNQHGIPFDVVFSRKYPHGIILPPILKTSDVIKSIDRAR